LQLEFHAIILRLILAVSYFTLIISLVASCHKKRSNVNSLIDPRDSLYTVQVYGETFKWCVGENAMRWATKKFGYKYVWVAGCAITDSLKNAVEKHNNIVFEELSKKFGDSYQKQLDQELNKDSVIERRIANVVMRNKAMISNVLTKYKADSSFTLYIDPIGQSSKYKVSVNSRIGTSIQNYSLARFVVDYNTCKMDIVSDKMERFQISP
jgi:hypothetical protein